MVVKNIGNHETILIKLSCLGFSDQVLGWIEELLCSRNLYVIAG